MNLLIVLLIWGLLAWLACRWMQAAPEPPIKGDDDDEI